MGTAFRPPAVPPPPPAAECAGNVGHSVCSRRMWSVRAWRGPAPGPAEVRSGFFLFLLTSAVFLRPLLRSVMLNLSCPGESGLRTTYSSCCRPFVMRGAVLYPLVGTSPPTGRWSGARHRPAGGGPRFPSGTAVGQADEAGIPPGRSRQFPLDHGFPVIRGHWWSGGMGPAVGDASPSGGVASDSAQSRTVAFAAAQPPRRRRVLSRGDGPYGE